MRIASCGIDFGTSNTSAAISKDENVNLVPVEGNSVIIPSAVFYKRNGSVPFYGRQAVNLFFSRQEGRFMRSLKRVLGTSLMKQRTLVNGKLMRFENIISSFLKNIKQQVDSSVGKEMEHVIMGRPVHFMDDDLEGDKRAESELRAIAQQIGFKHVEFQFEPIAGAFAHEIKLKEEKLAIVADLGGGTSDFTVIRLSNQFIHKHDRSNDILANTGVRVGGNDFDKDLSLAAVMPEIGYQTTYGEKDLEVPPKPFHDLAEWSKVNFLYTTKVLAQTRQFLHQAHDRRRYQRLLKVLEQETGHSLLAATEETKIALTSSDEFKTALYFIEEGLEINVKRSLLEKSIKERIERISNCTLQCLRQAQVKSDDIKLVILTGGSTELPIVQAEFKKLFPNAEVADENKLSSVGLGLAYDGMNRFR